MKKHATLLSKKNEDNNQTQHKRIQVFDSKFDVKLKHPRYTFAA